MSPQLAQGETPPSPRSHAPQSPNHRGAPVQSPQQNRIHHQNRPHETGDCAQAPAPLLRPPPPEDELADGDEADPSSALQKKRANSLNRHAASDGECDERTTSGKGRAGEGQSAAGQGSNVRAEGGKYATVTHRVGRSHSVRNQDKSVTRNQPQSITLRQKKKGPPPPPPKRSSSAISTSNSNLAEGSAPLQVATTTADGLLDVPYRQQRRASDLGVSVETGAVDTNSMGSVRSIAAMLEMSSIGGGAKGMALQKNFLQVRGSYMIGEPTSAR